MGYFNNSGELEVLKIALFKLLMNLCLKVFQLELHLIIEVQMLQVALSEKALLFFPFFALMVELLLL